MKFIIFFLIATVLPAFAAELALSEVPWTASSFYGESGGSPEREVLPPAVNMALMGSSLRVGDQHYPRGIGIWVGGDLIYHLDALADRFTAKIGMDDISRSLPGSPAAGGVLYIYADAVEVQRINFTENAVQPIDLDLRGKHLLQLHFHQRPGYSGGFADLVDGVFFTPSGEALQRQLEMAAQNAVQKQIWQPDYPDAPRWQQFEIEKVSMGLCRHAYRLSNGTVELILQPESGGRLVSVRVNGSLNYLSPDQAHNPRNELKQSASGDFTGGHFLRFLPLQGYLPQDALLAAGAYMVTFPREGVVRLTSAPGTWCLLQFEYEISLDPKEPRFRVTDRIVNTAPFPRKLAIWSVNRMDRQQMTEVQVPPGDGELSQKNVIISCQNPGEIPKTREIRHTPSNGVLRVDVLQRDQPRLRIQYDAMTALPQNSDAPLHFFISPEHFEIESHGKWQDVPPGGVIEHSAWWNFCME